ncbi:MAG: ABC transporter permease [Planctomycetaceae bacterium]
MATARTNWVILKTSLEARLVYRLDFLFATLVRFLPIVTQIFLWGAIFANADGELLGYTYENMVAYYLLTMIARAFSSMPGLASGIATEIRDGTVNKYLTQPVDMVGFMFWHRVAHKLAYYVMAAIPFAIVFWLCRSYLPGWPESNITLAWFASLVMGFLIGFLLEALIGLIAFWFLEVSSLVFIYMMINYFLSGHMIPIEWISEFSVLGIRIGAFVEHLPFQYLAYTPSAIMLGKIPPSEINGVLLTELAWVVGLFIAVRVAFNQGIKRYSAFGG